MENNVAYFSVNTQFENLGDALINKMLIVGVAAYSEVVVDVGRCPASFVESLGLLNPPERIKTQRGFFKLFMSVITSRLKKKNVFYFLNPGGLGRKLSWKGRLAAVIYNMFLSLYKIIGVNVCHVGMSFSKMEPLDKSLAKFRSKQCAYYYPRDSVSFNYVKSENFNVSGQMPDLAFFLQTEEKTNKPRSKIVFSFRVDSEYSDEYAYIVDMIDCIIRKFSSHEIVFLSQVARDDAFAQFVYQKFSNKYEKNNITVVLNNKSIFENIQVFSETDFVVSNRLHVLLLGASVKAVPYALQRQGASSKITNLFTDSGIAHFIVNDVSQIEAVLPEQRESLSDLFNNNRIELNRVMSHIFEGK